MQGDHQTQPFIIAAVRIDEMLGTDALGYLQPESAVWQPRTRRRCRSRCKLAAAPGNARASRRRMRTSDHVPSDRDDAREVTGARFKGDGKGHVVEVDAVLVELPRRRLLLEPVPVAVSSEERRAACVGKLAQARGCAATLAAIREEDYLEPRRSRSPAR